MILFSLIFATHVPFSHYFKCKDFDWLAERLKNTELLSPSQKAKILSNWIEHTDPKCFIDHGDAKD